MSPHHDSSARACLTRLIAYLDAALDAGKPLDGPVILAQVLILGHRLDDEDAARRHEKVWPMPGEVRFITAADRHGAIEDDETRIRGLL